MGWTFFHREKGEKDMDVFRREFGDGLIALKSFPTVSYGAFQCKDGVVIGLVILKQWRRNGYYNFCYKDMSENMGPRESDCPESILNLLTDPPLNDYAAEWRTRCRANLKKRAGLRGVHVGDLIKTTEPIHFSNGVDVTVFQVTRVRPWRLYACDAEGNPSFLVRGVGRKKLATYGAARL